MLEYARERICQEDYDSCFRNMTALLLCHLFEKMKAAEEDQMSISGAEKRCLKKLWCLVAHSNRVRSMPSAATAHFNSHFKKVWEELTLLVSLSVQIYNFYFILLYFI